jgi:arylsulfatase A-like enzyme
LITLDTTRGDIINFSLSDNKLTPNLAALASRGIHFDNAYSLIPITLPSHYSMFYSLAPHALKIYNNGQIRNIPHPSLAQLMKKKGYQTGAVISLGVLKGDFGLNRGFDQYLENFKPFIWYKVAEEVNRDAFELIDKFQNDKSFVWLHYSDPHEPYYPPYFEGDFQVAMNGTPAFTCKSIEQPAVTVNLKLKPGKNVVDFKTEIPKDFNKTKNISIGFITFQNFTYKTNGNVEVKIPEEWKKVEVRGDKINYFSKKDHSQLVLVNNEKTDTTVNLSFMYRMLERPQSRRFLYRKQIQYMDRQIGKLIERLKEKGMYEDSLFVIMGDHGEGLGEYKRHYGHIHYLNKVYSRVPLIVAGGSIEERGVRPRLASNLDIAPTILDAASIQQPEFMKGISLLKEDGPSSLILETYAPEAYFDAFSIIDFPHQIIFYPGRKENRVEFIDLEQDKYGIKNTLKTTKAQKEKAKLLNNIKEISRIFISQKGKIGKISEHHKKMLESLGYL